MSKEKDVVVNLSKKHPQTGEPATAGHTFVIGSLGNKKDWYEIDTEELNTLTDADLQHRLFEKLHARKPH
ncbi:hypothetical protein DCM91_01480 [Chitinophaga costaii]|nr:hypothetical protein [Chitinophaga costaii]PUZ30172.1 hypothetical protein DCM91_01480 [Chitinophaga costaii]